MSQNNASLKRLILTRIWTCLSDKIIKGKVYILVHFRKDLKNYPVFKYPPRLIKVF